MLDNRTDVLSPGLALQSFSDFALNLTLNNRQLVFVVFPSSLNIIKLPSELFPSISLYVTDSHPSPCVILDDVTLSNTFLSYWIFPCIAPTPWSQCYVF